MDEEMILPCRLKQDMKCEFVHDYWLSGAKHYSMVNYFYHLLKKNTWSVKMHKH